MMADRIGLVVLLVAAWGCAGGDEYQAPGATGGSTDLQARQYYLKKVDPEFQESCARCHSSDKTCAPKFLAEGNPELSYSYMKGYPAGGLIAHPSDSNLLLHGAHTGPALTGTQAALVTEWLKKEVPEEPEKNLEGALEDFGNCMKYDEEGNPGAFMQSKVWYLAYQSSDGGPCASCHLSGQGGTWIDYNTQVMFDQNRKRPWVKRWVKGVFEGPNFTDLQPSSRLIDKPQNVVQCGDKHVLALIDQENKDAIVAFVNGTLEHWRSGTCQ